MKVGDRVKLNELARATFTKLTTTFQNLFEVEGTVKQVSGLIMRVQWDGEETSMWFDLRYLAPVERVILGYRARVMPEDTSNPSYYLGASYGCAPHVTIHAPKPIDRATALGYVKAWNVPGVSVAKLVRVVKKKTPPAPVLSDHELAAWCVRNVEARLLSNLEAKCKNLIDLEDESSGVCQRLAEGLSADVVFRLSDRGRTIIKALQKVANERSSG